MNRPDLKILIPILNFLGLLSSIPLNTQICLNTNSLWDRLVWNSFLLLVAALLFNETFAKGPAMADI